LHPPGYPLQSLLVNTLAHTVGALPGVEPAWAVTLLSVLAMTLAIGLLYRVTRRLTGSHVAAALAMVIFAFSPGPWRTAITPEVYALNIALWALTLWLTLRAADTPSPQSDFAPQGTYWWLGLALGLAAGHHRTAFLLVPAAGLYLGTRRARSAAWGRLLAGMLLSAVVYLYLPLAHLWNSPMTPGDATSLAGFWELVSARAWAVFFHLPASFGELSSRLRDAFDAVADQLGVTGAGLGLVGLGWLAWQRPRQLALLGLPALGLLAFSLIYQVPDVATMLGPMVMILCLGLGGLVAGGWRIANGRWRIADGREQRGKGLYRLLSAISHQPSAIVWLLVVAVGGGLFIHNYPLVDESWDWRGQAVIAELDCELSATPGDVWLVAESGYAGPLVTYIAEQIGRPLVWANPWGEWDYMAALAEGRRVFLVKDMPGAWQYPDALTRLAGPDRYLMPTGNPDLLELVGPRKEPGAADLLPLADSRYVSLDEPFGPAILLRGYTIHRCRLLPQRGPTGRQGEDDEILRLTLYWESREKPDQDWRVKAHLIGADGTLLAQADSEHPARGARPTTRWGPGELVPDVHDFRLPPGADPLTARVVVGMYQIAGDEFPSLAETEIEIEIGDRDRDWR
jgi:hypothetical protein